MGMALCLAGAGKAASIAVTAFSLSWLHSVEKTEWREDYKIHDGQFVITEARVKGSGAGMDPGEGARLEDGWWVWTPRIPPVPQLSLAASGATASAWRLCHAGGCIDLGAEPGSGVRIWPCEEGTVPG